MELIIKELAHLQKVIPSLLKAAGTSKVWCLYGDLGAGKTTLIKAIAAHLGVQEEVTSPTYSLINEYEYTDDKTNAACYIYHMDLYRLKSFEEALDIGIEDYLERKDYCFIEWAGLIEGILPEDAIKISIEIVKDSERKIVFL